MTKILSNQMRKPKIEQNYTKLRTLLAKFKGKELLNK
jgi:hypothetical protein